MLRFDGCQFIKKFLLGDVSLSKHEHFAIAVNKVARVSKSFHPASVFLFYFIYLFLFFLWCRYTALMPSPLKVNSVSLHILSLILEAKEHRGLTLDMVQWQWAPDG